MFYLILPDLKTRTQLIEFLKQRNIISVFHYQALHASPMGMKLGGRLGQCPISEQMSDRVLRLPFHNALSELEVEYITCSLEEFFFAKSSKRFASHEITN